MPSDRARTLGRVSTVLDPLEVKRDEPVSGSGHPCKAFKVASFKADSTPGRFEAVVSVFNNIDRGGDRILPGAFADGLEANGLPPVVWSHQWLVPPIGKCIDAYETKEGLVIDAQLFVDPNDGHDVARQCNAAMREGALKEFSFAYDVTEARFVEEDGREIRELLKLDVFEVGPTLVGMNPATRLITPPKSLLAGALDALDAKDWAELLEELESKAGARNSSKDAERLQRIHDLAVENGAVCEGKSASAEHPDPEAARELLLARPR